MQEVNEQALRLSEFMKLTDNLMDNASKSAIAEVARILAVELGRYKREFGTLPPSESIHSGIVDEDRTIWATMADGLEHLAAALISIKGHEQPPTVQ